MNLLEAIKYIILGIVQGITEVLPISSSGHVELAKALFNMQEDKALLFLILVNTGSLVTLTTIYFKRLVKMVCDFFVYVFRPSKREERASGFLFAVQMMIATIPIALVGFIFKSKIEALVQSYGVLVAGLGLLLTGTVLVLFTTRKIRRGYTGINYADAVLVGMAQAIALLPGVSRSGMTASTAIFRGMGIDSALNFSFMLYIPASIGSIILYAKDAFSEGLGVMESSQIFYYVLAFFAAMVSTYIAYKFVFNIFRSGKIRYFGYYCIIIALFAIGVGLVQF